MDNFSILEWYYKVKSEPKEAAPLIVIILLVVFLGYKNLYAPKALLLVREERKLKGAQGQLNQIQSATQNADEISLEIEEQKYKFERAKKLCYGKNDITAFLRRVRELATLSKIDIKSINPQPLTKYMVGEIETELLTVSFNFQGDIVKLGIFMRMLELEEKITFLKLPQLSADDKGIFNLTLSPSTIIISDDLVTADTDDEDDFEDFDEYD
jgi:hypothetical protein